MSAADLLSGMMAVDDKLVVLGLEEKRPWMKMKEQEKERTRSG